MGNMKNGKCHISPISEKGNKQICFNCRVITVTSQNLKRSNSERVQNQWKGITLRFLRRSLFNTIMSERNYIPCSSTCTKLIWPCFNQQALRNINHTLIQAIKKMDHQSRSYVKNKNILSEEKTQKGQMSNNEHWIDKYPIIHSSVCRESGTIKVNDKIVSVPTSSQTTHI